MKHVRLMVVARRGAGGGGPGSPLVVAPDGGRPLPAHVWNSRRRGSKRGLRCLRWITGAAGTRLLPRARWRDALGRDIGTGAGACMSAAE